MQEKLLKSVDNSSSDSSDSIVLTQLRNFTASQYFEELKEYYLSEILNQLQKDFVNMSAHASKSTIRKKYNQCINELKGSYRYGCSVFCPEHSKQYATQINYITSAYRIKSTLRKRIYKHRCLESLINITIQLYKLKLQAALHWMQFKNKEK